MKTTHTVVILSEKVQKYFQSNIITNVIDKTGPAHCPTITVKILLPNDETFTGTGKNKKIAAQNAAKKALIHLNESLSFIS